MSDPQSQIGYSPQIDTLRALAVTGVLVSHFWLPDTHWGHLGVRLFFVISGYLITAILLEARHKAPANLGRHHIWRSFYLRRALRIFPAYYLLLACVVLLSPEARQVICWHALYGSNLLFATTNDWGYWPLSHLWSLSVEEQYYLVWPFIVLLVPNRILHPVLVAIILAAVLFRVGVAGLPEGPAKYVLTPAALDALGAGGFLAAVERRNGLTAALIRWLVVAGIAALMLYFWLVNWVYSAPAFYVFADLLLVFPMVALTAMCRRRPGGIWRQLFEHRVPMFLGRISYGIYLFHFPILALIYEALWAYEIAPPQHGPVLFAAAAAVTVAVASLSWYAVEMPLNRFKTRFGYGGPKIAPARVRA